MIKDSDVNNDNYFLCLLFLICLIPFIVVLDNAFNKNDEIKSIVNTEVINQEVKTFMNLDFNVGHLEKTISYQIFEIDKQVFCYKEYVNFDKNTLMIEKFIKKEI